MSRKVMKISPSYSWPLSSRVHKSRGSNPGGCGGCGTKVNWRSVNDRCWRCEMEAVKTRRPLQLDRELLMSLAGVGD